MPLGHLKHLVLITDKLPPARDNIGAYTLNLARSLDAAKQHVEIWSLGSTCSSTTDISCNSLANLPLNLTKLYNIVRNVRKQRHYIVLWQYNPYMYGWKGLPSSLCLLPLFLKLKSTCLVGIVFHEICYDFKRNPRSWAWAVSHRAALWLVLIGTDVAIVTTESRKVFLASFARRFAPWMAERLRCATVPVGSNISVEVHSTQSQTRRVFKIGTFRAGLSVHDVDLLKWVCNQLEHTRAGVQLVFVGGDTQKGLPQGHNGGEPGIVETGYLAAEEVSSVLSSLDVFVGLYDDGACGRRTSLAAACAHGLPIVSTNGHNTDRSLFRDGDNCILIRYGDAAGLRVALQRLVDDVELRGQLAYRARETYRTQMSWAVVADGILGALHAS